VTEHKNDFILKLYILKSFLHFAVYTATGVYKNCKLYICAIKNLDIGKILITNYNANEFYELLTVITDEYEIFYKL
jgi:hypothetical protein